MRAPFGTIARMRFFPFLPLALCASLALPALDAGATSRRGDAARSAKQGSKQAAKRTATVGEAYAGRADAMAFADEIAARQNLDPVWVRATLGQARLLPNVPRLMLPAPAGSGTKNWAAYRSRFVEPIRIGAGVRFWRDNAATLARAERDFGVPADIIVGIVGVETIYGRQMGSFRVLDALATLAFDFPQAHPRAAQRQAFFRGELENFLTQEGRTHADPTTPVGSYAGAMGMPQFMPSSIAKYAVDYDGDGRIDLVNDPQDVIGSVANYFKAFGWQPGLPATYGVRVDAARAQLPVLLAPDIVPSFSADAFVAGGAQLDADGLRHRGLLALIELQNGPSAPASYVAGTQNFYVITRYNWSSYYAMAVLELGAAVRAAMAQ